jgi:hypothetical protein
MKISKSHWLLVFLTSTYIVGFGTYYVLNRNFEFLWYVLVLIGFALFIGFTLKKSQFPLWLLLLLSLWGLLHMAGGGVQIAGHVLYAQVLIPIIQNGEFIILRYDQVVHAFGFGVTAIVFYFLLSRKVSAQISPFWLGIISISGATGLGALNEIIEFAAAAILSNSGVGGYVNTGLDLISNLTGAVFATITYSQLKK